MSHPDYVDGRAVALIALLFLIELGIEWMMKRRARHRREAARRESRLWIG